MHLWRGSMRFDNASAKPLRVATILPWLATLMFTWAPTVRAQQSHDLEQEVKQLNQEYEQQIADLQQRLANLEKKAAEQKAQATSAEKHSVTAQQVAQEHAKTPDAD